ncbi:MAG: redoxin family protein, partial [Gammaproteobacteria bacterium]|nr:redoxin family protein [Gammaproteobacteria bacterium]
GQDFEVIGVALDVAAPVQDFIDEIGVEYPILLAEQEGITIMLNYGNQLTTLPYTVIIDQSGKVVKAFRKEVSKQDILAIIQPLLNEQTSAIASTIK